MTVEEAIRQIRRAAGQLGRTAQALGEIQSAIEAPSADELEQMAAGARALSVEAHLIGVLQQALVSVEDAESDLRLAAHKRTLLWLVKEWKKGGRPSEDELRAIKVALAARRA